MTLAHQNCVNVCVQRRQELHVLTCDVFLMVKVDSETHADTGDCRLILS